MPVFKDEIIGVFMKLFLLFVLNLSIAFSATYECKNSDGAKTDEITWDDEGRLLVNNEVSNWDAYYNDDNTKIFFYKS